MADRRDVLLPRSILLAALLLAVLANVVLISKVLGENACQPAAWLLALWQPEIWPYALWTAVLLGMLALSGHIKTPVLVVGGRVTNGVCWIIGVGSFVLGFGVAAYWGWNLRSLPPLYHDEYSYIFQAHSFLSGVASYPEPPLSEHFRQVHVISDQGIYASRYFPGTGLWLAPFVAIGWTSLSGWFAQGLIACFTSLAAMRCGWPAGLMAGVMTACSPGLIVFSQTLLSPHPTMIGLAIGWWAFVETIATRQHRYALLSGLAIGFAFLTRPLTAVAIAGPWAMFAIKEAIGSSNRRWFITLVLSFLPAILILGGHNQAAMGSVWVTPYSHYTEYYTPSHVYGFFNKTRSQQGEHRPLDVSYDDWSTDLDLVGAFETTVTRIGTAFPWIGGLFPIVFMLVPGIVSILIHRDLLLLPLLSVLGLIGAYFPYFSPGIMNLGYLLEATPLVLFVAASGMGEMIRTFRSRSCVPTVQDHLLFLPIIMIGINFYTTLPPAFDRDSEIVLPRLIAEDRMRKETDLSRGRPTLILYDIDRRSDLQSTWVYNDRGLRSPILRAWSLDQDPMMKAFPDRDVWLFQDGVYHRLREADPAPAVP
ncbi:glycosyltransferase family 39 protein [bacterium]|nr:glycosyltransferase family 39 protein [bacterium]